MWTRWFSTGLVVIGCGVAMFFSRSSCAQDWATARADLVELLAAEGIRDTRVLEAMGRVERHLLVPTTYRHMAYENRPLPIGEDQTISQPFIVAYMTEVLELEPGDRVLEVGTGSGYQAAVLAELVAEVYTIEIIPSLSEQAQGHLDAMGYSNISFRVGDGYQGWPERAPFDAIIVTAAPDHIPQPLMEQLAEGGRLILPVGDFEQHLTLVERRDGRLVISPDLPVRFVPMTGEAQD